MKKILKTESYVKMASTIVGLFVIILVGISINYTNKTPKKEAKCVRT